MHKDQLLDVVPGVMMGTPVPLAEQAAKCWCLLKSHTKVKEGSGEVFKGSKTKKYPGNNLLYTS